MSSPQQTPTPAQSSSAPQSEAGEVASPRSAASQEKGALSKLLGRWLPRWPRGAASGKASTDQERGSAKETAATQAANERLEKALADFEQWSSQLSQMVSGVQAEEPEGEDGEKNESAAKARARDEEKRRQEERRVQWVRDAAANAIEALAQGADPNIWVRYEGKPQPKENPVSSWRALAVALGAMERHPEEAEPLAQALLRAGARVDMEPVGTGREPGFGNRPAPLGHEEQAVSWCGAQTLELMDKAGAKWSEEAPAGQAPQSLPMASAAGTGNAEAIAFLLSKGVSANSGRDESVALARAAGCARHKSPRTGRELECAKLLLDAGADPNGGDPTAVTNACLLGRLDLLRLLIERGARPEGREGMPLKELAEVAMDLHESQMAVFARTRASWSLENLGLESRAAFIEAVASLPARIEADRLREAVAGAKAEPSASSSEETESSAEKRLGARRL
jgi:hypothetical protein